MPERLAKGHVMPAQVDLDEFRKEVRQFLNDNLPARISNKVRSGLRMTKADHEEWHAILNQKGWLAVNWPVQFGGTGWTAHQRFIFEDEMCAAHAPRIVPFGLMMLGPVLQKFGSQAQRDRFPAAYPERR